MRVTRIPNISVAPVVATTDAAGNTTFTWNLQWWRYLSQLGAVSGAAGPGGPVVVITNVGNTFTPALDAGSLFLQIVLAADSTLLQSTGSPAGATTTWTLIIDNPTTAQLTLAPDASYFIGFQIAVAANTRAQLTWTNDENDDNSLSGSSFNNPIPS